MDTDKKVTTPNPENNPSACRGEVVFLYAFDLAYDMKREPIDRLLGQDIQEYSLGVNKRTPKRLFFYRPRMVTLPTIEKKLNGQTVYVQRSVKIFNVGAISIMIRVPFEVNSFDDLVDYHELELDDGTVEDIVNKLGEEVRLELAPHCIRPWTNLGDPEDYTVFCIYEIPPEQNRTTFAAGDWLLKNRKSLAGLLTQEQNPQLLSEQEAAESTERYLTYFENDLVVIDWDAALIVSPKGSFDDIIHVMELANVQLVELDAYDRILDTSLDKAYRDLARRRLGPGRKVQRSLREIRIDLARFSDELLNITKFFGDWYLAGIYKKISARFHLADWYATIREKLKTLGDLYQLLQQDSINFWMILLESSIVLLFVIDVILLFAKP
jgi:hypothetical protein